MIDRSIRLASLAPFIFGLPASHTACGDSSGPEDPEPVGLIVAGGQNAAFPGDTFALHTWFTDDDGLPLGVRPTGVRWTSSDSQVVFHRGDSLFVALELGTSMLTAQVDVEGTTFTASREFHVILPISGRMVWGRQPDRGQQARLVWRDLPDGPVNSGSEFGPSGFTGFGSPALSPDGRYVAIQAPRPISDIADVAIYLIDLMSNDVVILTDSMPWHQIAPRWSPDGDPVLFASNADGRWDIWSVPPDGGQPQRRVPLDAPLPVVSFDVSRADGGLVVSLTNPETGLDQLWEAALDGGLVRRITNIRSTRPRVSPDGGTIAYNAAGLAGQNAVFLLPRTGGTPRKLLPDVTLPGRPSLRTNAFPASSSPGAWSSDGRFVLVAWAVDATHVPADGRVVESWSYPGELYFVSREGDLRVRLTSWSWGDNQADLR